MVRRWLFKVITLLAVRHPVRVLIACGLVTLLGAYLASSIDIKTNYKDTLGPDHPLSIQQAYLESNFPAVTSVMIAIEGSERKKLIRIGETLKEAFLKRDDQIRAVYLEQPIDFFVRHGLLYMPTDELRMMDSVMGDWEDTVRGLLADPSFFKLIGVMEEVGAQQTQGGATVDLMTSKMFGRSLVGQGPWDGLGVELGISVDATEAQKKLEQKYLELFRESPLPQSQNEARRLLTRANEILGLIADVVDQGDRLSPETFGERMDELREVDLEELGGAERYRIAPDGRMLLMEVTGVHNVAIVDEFFPFQEAIQGPIDQVLSLNPDVTISLTGFPVIVKQESESMLNNFGMVTLLGFIGILAVFIIGFERVALPSLAAIPLLMGSIWTAGVQSLVYGELTLFSLAVPVLIFGVGIDFAIHLMSGYVEHRAGGLEVEDALITTFDKVGPGMVTGGLTTAAAFLVLMVSDFYGLRSLGFTAGVGVLMALLAMVIALPPLLVLWDRRMVASRHPLPHVSFDLLGWIGKTVRHHRYSALAAFLVGTMVFAYYATSVGMDTNYMSSLPRDLPAIRAQHEILERFGSSNDAVVLVVDDLEQAARAAKQALATETVSEVLSASSMIPPDQAAKEPYIAALRGRLEAVSPKGDPIPHAYDLKELSTLKNRMAKLKASLLEYSMLAAILYDQETQDMVGALRDKLNRIDRRILPASAHRFKYLDRLLAKEMVETTELLKDMTANTSITEADLPEAIVGRLRGKDGRWMVLARASSNPFVDEFRAVLLKELSGVDAEVAGLVPITHHIMHVIADETPRLTLYIFLLVAVLVFWDLRSVRGTFLALVPLVVGILWCIGIMGVLGTDFNMISVIAVPLIVGIGIDNGVHIYHRVRLERTLSKAMLHSGKAVVLTSLTTSIGFGSLMLSVHPGFFSLGMVTTIGILSCLVVSVLLLPALIAIFDEETLAPESEEE